MWFLLNIIFDLILYLIIDNITKFFIINNSQEYRFDILIYECFLLGFSIGFISFYHHITYLLILILFIHILGTLYTEKRFDLIKKAFQIFFQIFIEIFKLLFNRLYKFFSKPLPSKVLITKKLPDKYLYNYQLTPTTNTNQPSIRPGIFNLYGTTCSLNALLQSLASLNRFYPSLQRNINFSRFNYDPIVSTFLDLISQLRNDHHTSEYTHWNTLVDTSNFISKLNLTYPNLLTQYEQTDIAELFQSIIDLLNNALAKQISICSTNVIDQVQNKKLTTFSLDYLNKIFLETEAELYNKITLDNLDAQASYIIQYIDLTWLLHHIQLGSIIKNTFSGQILHAHCCINCSHVRFRAEPFQILTLPINRTNTTLERILSQLTKIEIIDTISCSYCSSQTHNDYERESKKLKQGTILTKIASTLSPILTTRSQPSGQIFSSTPTPPTIIPPPTTITTTRNLSRIKSQTMIANFPNILCIQLKRFSYNGLSQTITKLNTNILIEPEKILDLSNIHYTTWLGLTNLSTTIPSQYRLIAVCLHLSSPISLTTRKNPINGHYVCLYRSNHSRWFSSDDEHITELHDIEKFFQTPYVTQNCYLLFYERCL